MKYALVLAARARADILRNAEWWADNHSPDQAMTWFDELKIVSYWRPMADDPLQLEPK